MNADNEFARQLRESCGHFVLLGTNDRDVVEGEVSIQTRADIQFVEFCANLQQLSRSRQEIVEDHRDEVMLISQMAGNALISQHEASHWLQPGDLALIDGSEPSEFTYFGEFSRQRIAFLPRATVLAVPDSGARVGGNFLSKLDPVNLAIAAIIQKMLTSVRISARTEKLLHSALLPLLAMMVSEDPAGPAVLKPDNGSGTDYALLMARQYIDNRYRDANLSIREMAEKLRISLRQVQRSFAAVGTTPTKYLLIRRLEHARKEIDQVIRGRRSDLISTIAYEAGFSDLSYFQKTFRRAFGNTPREYLQGVGEQLLEV